MTARNPGMTKRERGVEGPAMRRYLDTRQAAAYLGLSPSTLNRMRVTGDGPPYSKVGRRVIYDAGDLDRWVGVRKRHFTGEAVGACES